MAGEKSVSPLLGKLGAALVTAHMASKDRPAVVGNIQLPGGIENGTAELRTCAFGTYEKANENQGIAVGQPFWMASGSVLSPKEFKGAKVDGLFTRVGPIPLCDTKGKDPKTGAPRTVPFAEHYDKVLNHLKNLGFDVAKIVPPANLNDVQKAEFIEKSIVAGMNQLAAAKPKFRFRTWQGKKQVIVPRNGKFVVEDEDGRNFKGSYATEEAAKAVWKYAGQETLVNHEWNGVDRTYSAPAPTSGVEDATAPVEDPNAPEAGDKVEAPPQDDVTAADAPFDDLADDLPTLAARASDDSDEVSIPAQAKLKELSEAAGLEWPLNSDGEAVAPGDTWEDLVPLIEAAREAVLTSAEGGESAAEPEAVPFVPKVKSLFFWKPRDKDGKLVKDQKTKRPAKAIEIVVKTVDEKTRTVTAVDNLTKKTAYKGISFDDLDDAA